MAERGGSTTQSGIYFQNATAARYMGRMLYPRPRPPNEQVSEVRVEAPEQVDDVVVTFASGRRLFIQVKENIVVGDEAWKKLWTDFEKQCCTEGAHTFRSDDRLVLFLGNANKKFNDLSKSCERAQGASDSAEWRARLTDTQRELVDKSVKALLTKEHQTDEAVWRLLRQVEVEIETVKMVEESGPYWMPPSSIDEKALFNQLVELANEQARNKAPITQDRLRALLQDRGVTIYLEWKPVNVKTTWTVPYRSLESQFVGRQDDLEALTRLVGEAGRVGIVGMGGLGKTQLAAEYAHLNRESYPHGVFWLNAANPLLGEFAGLAEMLGLAEHQASSDQAAFAVRDYLDKNSQALLIYDNLDDPFTLNLPVAPGLIPCEIKGRLLFTTRQADFPENLKPFEIKVLSEEAALQLLLRRRPSILDPMNSEHPAARDIVSALGGLPLALEVAAAYLGKPKVTLNGYLELLRTKGGLGALDLSVKYSKLSEEDLATRHGVAIGFTLETQWQALIDPDARQLFLAAGQLPEASWIPVDRIGLMTGITSQTEPGIEVSLLDLALEELKSASLIEELTSDRLRLHPLVHEFAYGLTPDPAVLKISMTKNLLQALQDAYFFDQQIEMRGVTALIADLDTGRALAKAAGDDELQHVARVLKVSLLSSAQVIDNDPRQLSGQLTGRLAGNETPLIQEFLQTLRETNVQLWLRPLSPSLRSPDDPLRAVFSGHEGTVRSLSITPDGERAISAGNSAPDVTLRVWDLHNCLEIFRVDGEIEEGGFNPVGLTPDGAWALCAISNRIQRWDVRTKKAASPLEGHQGRITWLAVADNCSRALSCSELGELILWDLASWDMIDSLSHPVEEILRVAITPDGKFALSWSLSTITAWDLVQKKEISHLPFNFFNQFAWEPGPFYLSPDGRWAQIQNARWRFDSQELNKIYNLPDQPTVSTFAQNGNLAITTEGSSIIGWDTTSGSELFILQAGVQGVSTIAVTPDGKRAIAAYYDHYLRFWDLQKAVRSSDQPDVQEIEQIELVGGGHWAVVTLQSGVSKVYDAANGQVDQSEAATAILQATIREQQSYRLRVQRFVEIKIQPDGMHRDYYNYDDRDAWMPSLSEKVLDLRGDMALTSEGQHAKGSEQEEDTSLIGGPDYFVRFWKNSQQAKPLILRGHSSPVLSGQISSDGRFAATSSIGRVLRVWDLEEGRERYILRGHSGMVYQVRLSPDDRYAVSVSEDRTLRVWEVGTGLSVAIFTADAPLYRCAVASYVDSGKLIIIAGERVGGLHFLALE